MRDPGRTPAATRSAALLAVAVAICVGTPALGNVANHPATTSPNQNPELRRVDSEDREQAVASFIACLNEAARSLAGTPVAIVNTLGRDLLLPSALAHLSPPSDPLFHLSPQPILTRLNLPPPTPRA